VKVGGIVRIGGSLQLHTHVYFWAYHVVYGRVSESPPTESTRFREYECSCDILFFRRTHQGGFTATNNPKSKLLPARWLQRRFLWLCYLHEEIFIYCKDSNIINTVTADSDLVSLGYGLDT
jgi:hypothetical protein